MKKIAFCLLGFLSVPSFAAIGSGIGGQFIQVQNTLQSGATFYVSSGTVRNLNTNTIKFSDGSTQTTASAGGSGASTLQVKVNGVQISSPTSSISFDSNFTGTQSPTGTSNISLNPGTTLYIQNTNLLQSGATFYVSSGSVSGPLAVFRGNLQAFLLPSTTEPFTLVNTTSHQLYMIFKTSGTNWWRVGSDVTGLGTPEYDIYNVTTGIKDVAISTNDVMTVNATQAFPSLTASQPLKLNSSKQVTSGLINVTSDITGTVPDGNLPSNLVHTNVAEVISSSKNITAQLSVNSIKFPDGTIQVSSAPGSSGSFINNQTTLQSSPANFYVEGATVSGAGFVARSTTTGGTPLSIYFKANLTGDQILLPWFYNVGFGDNIAAYLGYNTGGSFGTQGFTFNDASKNEVFKFQTNATNGVYGMGVSGSNPSSTLVVKNTIDNGGSFGVQTASTTSSLTLGSTYFLMMVDASGGNITVTLPDLNQTVSTAVERRWYKICRTDSSANTITFAKDSSDTLDVPDTLNNAGDCIDIIGRVGAQFGSTTAGTWSEVGRSVRNGFTGNLNITGWVHASDVIASETGKYAFNGTTVAFAAPPIDTSDRVPILNNGSVSWPLAVTDGARLGSTQTFTGADTFTSTSGVNVTYGIVGGSLTANDLTTNSVVYADSNKKLASATLSGLTLSGGVLTATGGGGSSTLAISTSGVQITSPTVRLDFDGNTFNGASGSVNIASITLNTSSVTLQGNAFNAANKLVQLNGSSQYPALDGSLINKVSSLTVVATAGTYGSATISPTITINAQGQVIALSSNTISGSAAQDFDLKDSTGAFNRQVNMSTNSLTNVSSITWANTYDSGNNTWSERPSTFSYVGNGAPGQSVTGVSSVTVTGLQFWAPANSTITGHFELSMNSSSSNSGGWKFSMIGPASPTYFEMNGGGSGASATTTNFSQQASALNTLTGNFLGTYTSGNQYYHFTFQLNTGATAGYVNVQVMGATGAGTNHINSESYIWAVLK